MNKKENMNYVHTDATGENDMLSDIDLRDVELEKKQDITLDTGENNEYTEEVTEQQSHEMSDEEEFDLSSFILFKSKKTTTRTSESGVFSIVYSKKNGKRVAISEHVIQELGNPETVQVGFSPESIAISEYLGEDSVSHKLKTAGGKKVIYSSELVQCLIDYYNLNFDPRTSITFSNVSYKTKNGKKVALISMK
ncbi:hypothetical protein [Anoxybacillus sp. MB8]|uniref:hypothetical protein n=1 Tax=Anoxybacillus sp. MB8 TaxID=2496850 RepID=UPI0013D4BCE7|nr:hypothetical protein [Anoxybacillus sp. MB8]